MVIRVGEVRHWVIPAGPADFLACARGLDQFASSGPARAHSHTKETCWNHIFSSIAFPVVVAVMRFSFVEMIGVILW